MLKYFFLILFPSIIQMTAPSKTTKTNLAPLPPILKNAPWECGNDLFTKSVSEKEILAKCPTLRDFVNSCCYAHDSCYDDQKGKDYCDDSFCHCLNVRTRRSKICQNESSASFCEIVKLFGDESYENAGKNQTTSDNLEDENYDYEAMIDKVNSTVF